MPPGTRWGCLAFPKASQSLCLLQSLSISYLLHFLTYVLPSAGHYFLLLFHLAKSFLSHLLVYLTNIWEPTFEIQTPQSWLFLHVLKHYEALGHRVALLKRCSWTPEGQRDWESKEWLTCPSGIPQRFIEEILQKPVLGSHRMQRAPSHFGLH